MIVEVVEPTCPVGTDPAVLDLIRQARADFEAAFGRTPDRFVPLSRVATIAGVGFFDSLHGQRGVAPNGIELHPVLGFALVSVE